MRQWGKGLLIWAAFCVSAYATIWVGTYTWEWAVGRVTSPVRSAIALSAIAVLAMWLINQRNNAVNRQNRGRYDGGIDQHRPDGE